MDANQLGRRNLTRDQFEISIGRLYRREKKTRAEAGSLKGKSIDQNDPCITADRIAGEYKVSAPTVKRYAKKAEEFERLEKEKPEVAKAIKSGERSFKEIKKEEKLKTAKAQYTQQTKQQIQTAPVVEVSYKNYNYPYSFYLQVP